MQQKIVGYFVILMVVGFSFSGCKKFEKEGYLPHAGIVLTFDDNYVEDWVKCLPLLDSTGIKATFFVSNYNKFTPDQKVKLRLLQSHGHEIAYHTVNHYNMVDYVYKYKHTMDELMQKEVLTGLTLMNRDGFYPLTAAYPYGRHCESIDVAMKRYFKSVRALNGTFDYSKSLSPTDNNYMLYGFGLDKSSKQKDATILKLLESTKANSTCAVLVGHRIDATTTTLSTNSDRIRKIAQWADKLDLKFYTVAEISRK